MWEVFPIMETSSILLGLTKNQIKLFNHNYLNSESFLYRDFENYEHYETMHPVSDRLSRL